MSRGTAVPTANEKFTLSIGCTFNRVIDSVTRVRCWSVMFTEALTFAAAWYGPLSRAGPAVADP